ncbi:uncharacterized protein [Palaemon carinicauda]|uniref:uncharacterized protein n=1 Tax=Palaemon carinicauda TaxID=392227 RepID=UPI0035B5C274
MYLALPGYDANVFVLVLEPIHIADLSGIKRATTRTFPGADVGSNHDLVFVNFKLRLKTIKKPKNTRMKFNLDRLRDPNIAVSFKATVGGKFAPLLTLEEDHSMETMTAQFNKVMIESANETLGNVCRKTQRWITDEIMDMCDKRRELKKNKTTPTGATEYREINRKIRKSMNQAKEDWIGKQCTEIEEKLEKNNSRQAFQIVKVLTKPKQARVSTIQDKAGNCLTEEDILKRWTEYCSDLYNYQTNGDPNVTSCHKSSNDDDFPVLREEVEEAIRSLKPGKAAGVDNIPAELIKHGGETVTDILTSICNIIWQTGE